LKSGVAVEELYPVAFRCFDENGLFQQPQAISLLDPRQSMNPRKSAQSDVLRRELCATSTVG
jgi:hypothetical protein